MSKATFWSGRTIRETFDKWWVKNPSTGCHQWTRSCANGYGQLNVGGRPMLAHRYSWERSNGPIPSNLHVLHRCDNRRCVNPDHLFLGTNLDNIRDMTLKGRGVGPSLHGESHPMVKLTWSKVQEIKRVYHAGGVSQRFLATQFGVSQTAIGRIVSGRGWRLPRRAATPVRQRRVTVAASFDLHWKEDEAFGCWVWQLALNDSGHGKVSHNGKKIGAHKFSYQRSVGPVPDGLVVRHFCDNPACVNPAHLCLGIQADNVRDMVARGRQRGASGERNSHAKITRLIAAEIRNRSRTEQPTQAQLADEYGLSPAQIGNIVRGESWRPCLAR